MDALNWLHFLCEKWISVFNGMDVNVCYNEECNGKLCEVMLGIFLR